MLLHDSSNWKWQNLDFSFAIISIVIIVFNIESILKYLLFNKLHKLMDSNIFVTLS